MSDQPLEISTTIQISKSPAEVFETIVDPAKMANYFIEKGSGRMEEGMTIEWKFPEFPDKVPIRVGKMVKDQLISYIWNNGPNEMLVEMNLKPQGNATVVNVTEKCVKGEADIKWLKQNTEGWANFLACLKAWMEYGVNLRKGAFDFMRKS